MNRTEAIEEYRKALKAGQREYKELLAAGKSPYPEVLDELLPEVSTAASQYVGAVEIPTELIRGTKSAGRISAFSAGFAPLLEETTEFCSKWVSLCMANLSDEGIREPIVCFEYYGSFYIQEGNKRVSVLKHFGAPRISGVVTRILPENDDSPRYRAYQEFLEFYKTTGLYTVQFHRPGDYGKLLAAMDKELGQPWTDREKLSFNAGLQYFKDAFDSLNTQGLELPVQEALLIWLQVYSYQELTELSREGLKKSIAAIWEDLVSAAQPEPVKVETELPKAKTSLLNRLISAGQHLKVAFIHQLDTEHSGWAKSHEEGRLYLEQAMEGHVTTVSYFNADTPEQVEAALEQAVEDGAQVVFTTTPQQGRATLKAAVRHPKVRFLNCAVNVPYSSIRSYYCRMYEGKFVTGAIAGAVAANDQIGYIAAYPIYGELASINAFALGAQLTNPRAKIHLRWSCQETAAAGELIKEGIRVISNREVPSQDATYLNFCNYGTYQVGDDAQLTPLGSPCWNWGKLYEHVLRSLLSGAWEKESPQAVNYWWGMDNEVVDIQLSDQLPDGVKTMAQILIQQLKAGELDPFAREIIAQDGTVINDGSRELTADELLHMDYLCHNVQGSIPGFEELLPEAQPMVRELGIYKEDIPARKEVRV